MNTLPRELSDRLAEDSHARAAFDALPPSHKREYVRWISEAKRPQTRHDRAAKAINMILAKANA